jgi:hypothetical protein
VAAQGEERKREGGGGQRGGGGCNNWEKERWSARVGKEGGSHPSDRDQRPEHALSSEVLTPAEKNAKRSIVSLRNASQNSKPQCHRT